MNPYEILDIDPSANLDDIKKAYRKLSMTHHPDKGGDEEKFMEINLAYRVLSDPQKRKMYDTEGIIVDESPEHVHNIVKSRLAGILESWLENMMKGMRISMKDFFESNINDAMNQIKQNNARMKASATQFKDIRKRVSCKSDGNIIHGLIDKKLEMIEKSIKQNENEKIIMEGLKIAVTDYNCEEEQQEVTISFGNSGTISRGTTSSIRW